MARHRLKQRKDGRYRLRYKGKEFYGYTEREVFEERDAYIRDTERGYNRTLGDCTFGEYAALWFSRNKKKCTPKTRKDDIARAKRASVEFGNTPIKDITSSMVKEVFENSGGMSKSYIQKYCRLIYTILETAYDDCIIQRNPAKKKDIPKGQSGTHRALTQYEIDLVVKVAKTHDFGDAAMVMLFSGARRGEMLALNIDRDIDFDKKRVIIREAISYYDGNTPTLSKGKNDFVERKPPLIPILENQLAGKHGLVYKWSRNGHGTEQSVKRKMQSFCSALSREHNGGRCKRWYGKTNEDKAFIAAGGKMPPWEDINIRMHDFRHTYCVMLFDAGVDLKTAQTWMGHSDANMILKIYDHLSEQREERARISVEKLVGNFSSGSKSGSK